MLLHFECLKPIWNTWTTYHVKSAFFFSFFFFEGTAMGVIGHFFPLMYGFPFPPSSQNFNFIAYHVNLYLAIMTLFLEIAILFLINESIYCIVNRNCNLFYSKTLNLCISQFYFISCNYNMIFSVITTLFIIIACYFISHNCDFVSQNFAIVM